MHLQFKTSAGCARDAEDPMASPLHGGRVDAIRVPITMASSQTQERSSHTCTRARDPKGTDTSHDPENILLEDGAEFDVAAVFVLHDAM